MRLGVDPQPGPNQHGQFIQQCHGERAPLDHQARRRPPMRARPIPGSRSRSTPVSKSRPPFRYSGRPVNSSSPRRGRLPIRRAPAASTSAIATACGTASTLRSGRGPRPLRDASSHRVADHRSRCRQTIFAENATSTRARMSGADTGPPAAVSTSNRPPGRPWAEHLGLGGERIAEPVQHGARDRPGPPSDSTGRPEMPRPADRRRDRAEPRRIDLQRMRVVAGEQPGGEGVPTGNTEPL